MAQGLLKRICLKSLNKIKNYPFPYHHLKKIIKFQNFLKENSHTLSHDRESLVTSLLVFFFEDFHLSKQFHFVQNFFEYKIKFITRKFFFLKKGKQVSANAHGSFDCYYSNVWDPLE